MNSFSSPTLLLLLPLSLFGCAETTGEPNSASNHIIAGENSSEIVLSDWPQMFGPSRDSRSPETWVDLNWKETGPAVLWRTEIGRGYSGPVVKDDKLVVLHRIDDWELCTCFSTQTGESHWQIGWPTSYRCVYEYSDGPYATPLINGEEVFLIGAEAQMLCLDLETGERRWSRNLKTDFQIPAQEFGFGASPCLWSELLFVNTGGTKPDSGIVALDRRTGETVWTSNSDVGAYCTPIVSTIASTDYLFVLSQENLNCLNPHTGELYWAEPFGIRNTPQRVNAVSPLLVDEDQILISSGPGPGAKLFRIMAEGEHELVWGTRRGGLQPQYTNLWQSGELIFGFTPRTYCELLCVAADTGETLWKWNHEQQLRRAMTIAVGTNAIALDETGRLFLLQPDSSGPNLIFWGKEPLLEEPCFTQPILSRGLLFLRNERELVCLDLRPESQQLAQSRAE